MTVKRADAWSGFDVLVVSPTPTHPQNQGNRRRLFHLCSELKRQGARVHLLHYAADLDWRHRRPEKDEREMAAAWDSYQLVAPSPLLHQPAVCQDHLIDEWADPALTQHLSWAFAVRRYDIVIVCYTWMSFCFDAVPRGVFRICDTNDVFSGRRALLQANGVEPEFFYTTAEQEAKGLARAHLVWAIKESELLHFQRLGLAHCRSLLHAEPDHRWWRKRGATDGWLRVGVLGAFNNVNRRNLEDFLATALPLFASAMAPVRILIAGGCADHFKDFRHPNVELLGSFDDVANFYAAVDVVCAPIRFSTGLKIKVAEALAAGAPLVALAHAMDGFPSENPAHLLPDFRAMADELIRISFDRSKLVPLAASSRRVSRRIRTLFRAALEATRCDALSGLGSSICVVAPLEAWDRRSLLHDHLQALVDGLHGAVGVLLYAIGSPVAFDPDSVTCRDGALRVFLAPESFRALGAKAPERWTPLEFRKLLRSRSPVCTYLLSSLPQLENLGAEPLGRVVVRYDAVALSGTDPAGVIRLLRRSGSPLVLSTTLHALPPSADGSISIALVPFGGPGAFGSFVQRLSVAGVWGGLLVISEGEHPLSVALAEIARSVGVAMQILDVSDVSSVRELALPLATPGFTANVAGARLVVDLGTGHPIAEVVAEGARRSGVPVIRLIRGVAAAALYPAPRMATPTTDGGLLRAAAQGLVEGEFRAQLINETQALAACQLHNDAGWRWLSGTVQA